MLPGFTSFHRAMISRGDKPDGRWVQGLGE